MRPFLLSVVLGLLLPVHSRAQCLLDGGYVSTPSVSYTCALGFVAWNVQRWDVVINGNQITVSPFPQGTLPMQLTGTIDCQSGAFSASALISGGCSEIYTLSATVQTIASWSGTFSAQYTGSQCGVAGCVSHTIPVTGALSPTGVAPGAPSLAWLDIGPNPFGESTTVRVRVVGGQFARLVVHDIAGHTVATLIDGRWLEGGEHEYRWNRRSRGGRRVPAGVYFVRLQTGSTSRVAKLVVLN